jgi:hypothetical protein
MYPFSYYLVSDNENKYILQLMKVLPNDSPEIEKKLNKEINLFEDNLIEENISIIEYGVEKENLYILLEFFTLETLEDVLNTTTKLSDNFTLNLILFLSKWQKNISKPHIFLSPSNIISLGNNQFKVFNYKVMKIVSNYIRPFYFFKESVSKYLAPELTRGDRLISKKADIYSIGRIWETIIDIDLNISEEEDSNIKKKIKDIIKEMIKEDYESREINEELLEYLIENYLTQKSNEDFTTQKINIKDIIIEEIEEIEHIEEIKEESSKGEAVTHLIQEESSKGEVVTHLTLEESSKGDAVTHLIQEESSKGDAVTHLTLEESSKGEAITHLTQEESSKGEAVTHLTQEESNKGEVVTHLTLEEEIEEEIEHIEEIEEIEIEPEIIIKKVTPPSIPIAPPTLKIKKITEKEFKIAKKQLNKNPIDSENLKILYLYYSDKEMIDEAFIISNLLNFMNDSSSSNLLFEYGKNVSWVMEHSIITDNTLEKILPKKIYFNTSGVMQALYKILDENLPIIKTTPPLSNYSILINDSDKKDIINEVIALSGLKNLRISLTNQNIHNEKSISSAIFKRDNFINIMLKKDLFEEMENSQFKVLISKLVFLSHSNIVGNFIYDVATIKDIFYGAMKFVIPSSRDMYNSKISNILFKELEKQKNLNKLKRTDIIRLVMLMNEHLYNRKSQPDISESMKLIEIASDRFALIVSNDLNATLKTFLNYESINVKLTATERMKSLLRYVMSDEYFQLRKDIKQSVKA